MGRAAIVLLVALLSAGDASAQDRGPSAQERRALALASEATKRERAADPAARAARMAELDAWLRRLVGRFRMDGDVKRYAGHHAGNKRDGCIPRAGYITDDSCGYHFFRSAHGSGDCVGVGNGPGIHCVFNVPWPRFIHESPIPRRPPEEKWLGSGTLDPAVLMFGLDPDSLGIRYMLVGSQSIAIEATGVLEGDTLTFKTRCPNEGGQYNESNCSSKFWIVASPDGQTITINLEWRNERIAALTRLQSYQFLLKRLPEK